MNITDFRFDQSVRCTTTCFLYLLLMFAKQSRGGYRIFSEGRGRDIKWSKVQHKNLKFKMRGGGKAPGLPTESAPQSISSKVERFNDSREQGPCQPRRTSRRGPWTTSPHQSQTSDQPTRPSPYIPQLRSPVNHQVQNKCIRHQIRHFLHL